MRILLTVIALWFAAFLSAFIPAWAAESETIDTGRVNATFVTSHDALAPGQTFDVALVTELDEKWHTYWRNPGDSGEPVHISLNLPEGASHGEIAWPVPMPVPTGPIINYGFEGTPVFPIRVTVPEDATEEFTITADAYYLVCYDICVPEDASFTLTLPVFDAIPDPKWAPRITEARSNAPMPAEHGASVREEDGRLIVDIEGVQDLEDAYLFPHPGTLIDHSAPQTVVRAENGLRFDLTPGFGWPEDFGEPFQVTLGHSLSGGATEGLRAGRVVTVVPNGTGVTLAGLGASTGASDLASGASQPLIGVLAAAFLGGLILNLMPCVFPVISLKALSLTKAAHGERNAARREGWAYTAGVLATFAVLAMVIIGLKAAGATLGWGFQLQNPVVVGALALLVFVIGLNLLGLFEIGGRLQNTGQTLTEGGGTRGAFFTGMLAVIVATPCSAPFMAGAVGYALAQGAPIILVTLLALGLGLAAPFLLLAYMPGLLARLPRPGAWMETFRQVLAFPMFLTAIWLVWVLGNQIGTDGVALVLLAMLVAGFAVWLGRRAFKPAGVIVGLLAFAVLFGLDRLAPQADTPASVEIASAAWSPERVAEERAAGRPVFVDFTADWCVTCKVNERLVLKKPSMETLFSETNTAFLVADWTNKNDAIAQELARYDRAGVPLYLVYPPGTEEVEAQILPQVLTQANVSEALRKAAGG